jgi:hypothetical protein
LQLLGVSQVAHGREARGWVLDGHLR